MMTRRTALASLLALAVLALGAWWMSLDSTPRAGGSHAVAEGEASAAGGARASYRIPGTWPEVPTLSKAAKKARGPGTVPSTDGAPVDSADENRMLFQRVPEEKVVKNRLHVDVHTREGEREAKVKTLIDLGARKLWDGQMGPMSWITLADPEGNEFCVS